MIDAMLSVLAPHYCYGCQNPPKLLCAKCNKYNRQNYNTSNKIEPVTKYNTIEVNYIDAREGALKAVIDGYKFQREKSSYKILARMLNDVFPVSKDEIITIIPTSTAHKRERGYDHMKLIGRYYAKLSNATFAEIIEGNRAYSQHKKNYKDRQNLSKNIFSVKDKVIFKDFVKYSFPVTINELLWGTGTAANAAIIGHLGKAAASANSISQIQDNLLL